MTINAVEFIHRFLMHVLPSGFVKIRYFGFLANRNRCEALRLCRSFLPPTPNQSLTLFTEAQRRSVERKCPFCHVGTLHVVERISAALLAELSMVPEPNSS